MSILRPTNQPISVPPPTRPRSSSPTPYRPPPIAAPAQVQYLYYVAIALTSRVPAYLTPDQFYANVTEILAGYNANKNFVTYLVDGTQHTYTNKELYYTSDADGTTDNGA